MISAKEQQKAAREFAKRWEGKGYEKGQSQQFWIDLLQSVYEVTNITEFISFEDQVHLDHTSFIDGYIKSTKVMIEQKSIGKDLRKGIKQSDGTLLTPFQQAKRYVTELPLSQHPRWIITCNFSEFLVYDMEKPNGEPEQILLKDLEKDYYRLKFLVIEKNELIRKEERLSIEAGTIVGKIHDALKKQYADPDSPESLKSLNKLCVRLVFCLYAEDADIFGSHQKFHDYMKQFSVREFRGKLIELFRVLDTPEEKRDRYLEDDLKSFPYVNGGLFSDEDIEIPRFTEEIVNLILHDASEDFDWSGISPTIFGAVFESTLNSKTRRSGGMHYTSIENIHKVIDPLFLDDLRSELEQIRQTKIEKILHKKLNDFQDKLASLVFFDPACGSGNFLTETYISLRTLENELLKEIHGSQMVMENPIKVSISQFYGIEINDFAVAVAQTAMWIAELKMLRQTEQIIDKEIPPLPLETFTNIVEGNALRIDWESVVPKEKLSYIIGNPPFVGYSLQSKEQKADMLSIYVDEKGKPYKTAGKIDYVAAWYFKAAQLMENAAIRTAFVSTNSITQGEQVAGVWKPLYDRFGIHIDFAHRTFKWDNRGEDDKGRKKKTDEYMAAVHVVIVGFSSAPNKTVKRLFDNDTEKVIENISPYLIEASNIFIEARRQPLCDVPEMVRGSQPTDDGNFILTEEEKTEFLKVEPQAEKFIRPFMMGKDFIQRKPRYCLWLVGANPSELKKCRKVLERVENVRKFRLASPKKATQLKANTPTLFDAIIECSSDYVALPKVSSESRRYIPIEYLSRMVIPGDKLFTMQNSTIYHFGVLTSNVHMAWMRTVCGRLKSDYSYSNTIVYNNFPWCDPTPEQKAKIEQTAQAILDARALYPDSSLADLYDETTMPPELRKAHQQNDKAVMQAYGFSLKMTESECVAELMKMYQRLTEQ